MHILNNYLTHNRPDNRGGKKSEKRKKSGKAAISFIVFIIFNKILILHSSLPYILNPYKVIIDTLKHCYSFELMFFVVHEVANYLQM